MSIYHCSIKIISRSSGRSAVSAAAYRSGERLYNEETGLIHDYTAKDGVIMNEIMLPDDAPVRLLDRATLWNEVQKIEKRTDAQFAREVEVALPYELTREQQIECVRSFIKENFTSNGMIADWALHDKGDGNPHAHILLTVREINEKEGWQVKQKSVFANARDEKGKPVFDPSKPSYDPANKEKTSRYRIPVLDENGMQKVRIREGKGTEFLWERISIPANDWNEHGKCEQWRASWAEHCNTYLPPELRIDHRSYERRGIDMEPTIHEGVTARKIEKEGKISDRCEMNRSIRLRNQIRQKIAEQFNELSKNIITKARDIYERFTRTFTGRKSGGADRDTGKTGRDGISHGRSADTERFIGTGTDSDKTASVGEGGRAGRADEINRQLEQRERTSLLTDKRIDELKRIIQKKEVSLDERIRNIMEHRGSRRSDGRTTITKRDTGTGEHTEGRTDSASLIRDIRFAIDSANIKESVAGKERDDREAKRRRPDLSRERTAESERQTARERDKRYKKPGRESGPCL